MKALQHVTDNIQVYLPQVLEVLVIQFVKEIGVFFEEVCFNVILIYRLPVNLSPGLVPGEFYIRDPGRGELLAYWYGEITATGIGPYFVPVNDAVSGVLKSVHDNKTLGLHYLAE